MRVFVGGAVLLTVAGVCTWSAPVSAQSGASHADQTGRREPSKAAARQGDYEAAYKQAFEFWTEKRLPEAAAAAARAVELTGEQLGTKHTSYAQTLNLAGTIAEALGEIEYAETQWREALAIIEQAGAVRDQGIAAIQNNLGNLYVKLGKFALAEKLFTDSRDHLVKFLGPTHLDVAQCLSNLADLYRRTSRRELAEPLLQQSLAIREKSRGPQHPDVADALNNLGILYQELRRFRDAEQALARALSIRQKSFGSDDITVAQVLNNLGSVYVGAVRYEEAAIAFQRALDMRIAKLGDKHVEVAQSLSNLAGLSILQGRLVEAEPLLQRAIIIREAAWGAVHPDLAISLQQMAILEEERGNYSPAEQLYKRCLTINEQAFGPSHDSLSASLEGLGSLYVKLGRYREAEQLFQRRLNILRTTQGEAAARSVLGVNSLALLYQREGRLREAEQLYVTSLRATERQLGPRHGTIALGANNLAGIYNMMGRHAEAILLLEKALAIWSKNVGSEHYVLGDVFNSMGVARSGLRQFREAGRLLEKGLALRRKTLGASHPLVAESVQQLGRAQMAQQNWSAALVSLRHAADIQFAHKDATTAAAVATPERSWSNQDANLDLVAASWGAAEAEPRRASELREAAFKAAQLGADPSTGKALTHLAERSQKDPAVGARLRERQDLQQQWQSLDRKLIAGLGAIGKSRDEALVEKLRSEIGASEKRIESATDALRRDFPHLEGLSSQSPLELGEVQSLLAADEALIAFSTTADQTFTWSITRETVVWKSAGAGTGTKPLALRVNELRDGLGIRERETSKNPPLDIGPAHELYLKLFGNLQGALEGKSHLIIVPSVALSSLPFNLLLTTLPSKDVAISPTRARDMDWLVKRFAISVLPTVSSLRALRINTRPSRATKPMVGFGNPVFDPAKWTDTAQIATAAKPVRVTQLADKTNTALRSYSRAWRGQTVDSAALRQLAALPETADELRAVGAALGLSAEDLFLGATASETTVKRTILSDYKIVYFATHGLVAGEIKGFGEPSLALTLPAAPSDEDDGLLTASEVAQLKLDADWVVLSACNTAAGDEPGAAALSGLAKAFFFAGARSLMVSHWQVDSDAAVRLTTRAFEELTKNPGMGRAEALRRSMIAQLSEPNIKEHWHPSYWGPFMIVGEGGAGR
jgi:CHAT domain-containing protein/Tfp pilus assembly protein PilF